MSDEVKKPLGTIAGLQFEIAKLTLQPGDVLVLRLLRRGIPTEEFKRRLTEEVQSVLSESGHPDTKVLVLQKDMTLEVLEHAP